MRRVRDLSLTSMLVALLSSSAPVVMAQGGTTLMVAPDGSADFETIAAAIEAASDGDTVLIAPGTYVEGLLVDKDITLTGAGDRAEVVIEIGPGTVRRYEDPGGVIDVGVVFEDVEVAVERLSFRQSFMEASLVSVVAGAVDFSDVAFDGTEVALFGGEHDFSDTVIDAYFAVRDGASPTVEDSEIIGHASVDGPGRTVIRGSTLRAGTSASAAATGAYEGNHFIGEPLEVDSGSDMIVRGNLIEGVERGPAILVHFPETTAQIIGNTVRDSLIGIAVDTDAAGSTIESNELSGVRIGIHVDSSSPVSVADNTIEAATTGIVLEGDGASVVGNAICGSGSALEIRSGSPSIFSNAICAELEP